MSKFKVGDRVWVREDAPVRAFRGRHGVVGAEGDGWDWEVHFTVPGERWLPLDEAEMELVTPVPAPDPCVDCLSPGCRVCNPWPFEEQDDAK